MVCLPFSKCSLSMLVLRRGFTAFLFSLAYRLYTVIPRLINLIEELTNSYIRFNRKRMKGSDGIEDSQTALNTLFEALFTLCQTMVRSTFKNNCSLIFFIFMLTDCLRLGVFSLLSRLSSPRTCTSDFDSTFLLPRIPLRTFDPSISFPSRNPKRLTLTRPSRWLSDGFCLSLRSGGS